MRTRAAGFELVETTFRLVRGVRRLDVIGAAREARDGREGERPRRLPVRRRATRRVAYELTGGVGGGAVASPASAAHIHAIRHWVALEDADATVAWSTLEAPLVQLGNVFLPYPPYPETIDGAGAGLVTSWVTNNVWDTNFPPTQGGEVRFDYAVASAAPGRRRALARDRDRGRADPTARRRARRDRAPAPGRNACASWRPRASRS